MPDQQTDLAAWKKLVKEVKASKLIKPYQMYEADLKQIVIGRSNPRVNTGDCIRGDVIVETPIYVSPNGKVWCGRFAAVERSRNGEVCAKGGVIFTQRNPI